MRGYPKACGQYSKGCAYKFQPAGVWVLHQILAKVRVVHHFVEERKWMTRGRIHAEERNNIPVRELDRCPNLPDKPLGVQLALPRPCGQERTYIADFGGVNFRRPVTSRGLNRHD